MISLLYLIKMEYSNLVGQTRMNMFSENAANKMGCKEVVCSKICGL
jgi:hypothetical protein